MQSEMLGRLIIKSNSNGKETALNWIKHETRFDDRARASDSQKRPVICKKKT